MIPADKPLTLEERSSIEVALNRMRRFEQASAHAKVEILKSVAKVSFRLAAEVARLEKVAHETSTVVAEELDHYRKQAEEFPAKQAEVLQDLARLRTLIEAADRKQFAADVELENLRKQLVDARQFSAQQAQVLENLEKAGIIKIEPRPMCRPDPLEGIIPPTQKEGS